MERLGNALVLTVLDEAPHELVARVFLRRAVRQDGARKDHLRLDVDEKRLDVEKLGGDLEVELLHEDEVLVVLAADVRDRDVAKIHLVLADEVEQQVQRPLELGHLDRVGLHEVRAGGDGNPELSHGRSEEPRDFLEG